MENNLLPSLILVEAGIKVNETSRIHIDEPIIEEHTIYMQDTGLLILLQIWGVLSLFYTLKPTNDEIESCDKILITLDSAIWDPHTLHFVSNE